MTCEKAGEVTTKTRSKFLQLGVLLLRSKSTYFYYVVKVRRYLLYPSKQLYNPQQKATKRRRCDVCGSYGHMYEDCFLLEKSEEIEHAGIHVLPIEDIVMDDDEWEAADGCEAQL